MNSIEKRCLAMLDIMNKDMQQADPLYTPTDFWKVGCEEIIKELHTNGLAQFRSRESTTTFFVPTYSRNYYKDHKEIIDPFLAWLDKLPYRKAGTDVLRLLNGYSNAFTDFRIFKTSDTSSPPLLKDLSESTVGEPSEQFVFEGKNFSLSFLNYLRGLTFLKRTVKLKKLKRVLEIGGGFGTLGEIVLKSDQHTLYIDVDLPPVATIATYYLKEIFGDDAVLGYDETRDWSTIDLDRLPGSCRALVLCPWQLPKVMPNVDLFANFISFQEMEPAEIKNYIRLVQNLKPDHILLRNLREGKNKIKTAEGVAVNNPTTIDQMIEWFDNYSLAGRDTASFGELKIDHFHSEVVVLKSTVSTK